MTPNSRSLSYDSGQQTRPMVYRSVGHVSPTVQNSVQVDNTDVDGNGTAMSSDKSFSKGHAQKSFAFPLVSSRDRTPEDDPVSIFDPQALQKDTMAVLRPVPLKKTRDDWGKATAEAKDDEGPNIDDIYESDNEHIQELEETVEAVNPRSGLISSVATSIGNVVRGATGYS